MAEQLTAEQISKALIDMEKDLISNAIDITNKFLSDIDHLSNQYGYDSRFASPARNAINIIVGNVRMNYSALSNVNSQYNPPEPIPVTSVTQYTN